MASRSKTINMVIEELYNSKATQKTLMMAPKKWREDLKSHVFLILLEMDNKKLMSLYNRGEIDAYIYGICQNQFKLSKGNSKKKSSSSFWKLHKMFDDGEIIDADKIVDEDYKKHLLDYWDKYQNDILDKFYSANVNSINYFFNRKVFELYYLEGMTFKQISIATKINHETVRQSVYFTLQFVKNELKNYEKSDELNR